MVAVAGADGAVAMDARFSCCRYFGCGDLGTQHVETQGTDAP
jgi:hypothetical protein